MDPGASPHSDSPPFLTFDADPNRYRHWKLSIEGPVATLAMDVDANAPVRLGYALKLNSYDLGVDIELHDALQRLRFEHPAVRTVVLTSARERVFCSGANIFMLAQSSHAWKVNFCRFTNETRIGMEDSSRHTGLKFLAACNGTTAGGGYELALACDEILLVDDRSAAVSLPEVPLLGVLPGTGGLTRLIDKRRVRRDHADLFCTLAEGVRAPRAKEWRLIDHHAKPQQFAALVRERALELARTSERPAHARGVRLEPLERSLDARGYRYSSLDVRIDRSARTATLTVSGPQDVPQSIDDILRQGSRWWPLRVARELEDAILMLRTNEVEAGLWILRTRGSADRIVATDAVLERHRDHWFVRETIGLIRRTLARLEVSSRSLFALIDERSCFCGTLFELALAADRIYMRAESDSPEPAQVILSTMNFGSYPTLGHVSRLQARFHRESASLDRVRELIGKTLLAGEAAAQGLVTVTPDALDWSDEVRLAIEERTTLSPDALTGMEQNLRMGAPETLEARIFGRLSAWQNWVFARPNAVGEAGALKLFGTGKKARFDWPRV